MPTNLILSLTYLLTELTTSGISIRDALKEAEETGVIPQEKWDDLKAQFNDAQDFWGN